MASKSEPSLIRIYLGPSESGWAYDLGHGLARIANIPISGHFNFKDLVTVRRMSESIHHPVTLIKRRFARKSLVQYQTLVQFEVLVEALVKRGCACEGLFTPTKTHSGWIAVAHSAKIDPHRIARRLGVVQD